MHDRWSIACLSKFANIANALALESTEVGGNAGVFQVDDTGEGLVEERADREDREVAGFGLSRRISVLVSKSKIEVVNNLQPECGSWL